MFQSVDGPTIEFYNPNGTKMTLNDKGEVPGDENNPVNNNVPTEEKSTTTEIIDRVEEGIQLNLKDLFSNKTLEKYDEEKLKKFLENAYILMSNALDSQIKELYVEDEAEVINTKNYTYRSLFKFPSLNVDLNNKNEKKKIYIRYDLEQKR